METRVLLLISPKPDFRAFSVLLTDPVVNKIDKEGGDKINNLLEEFLDRGDLLCHQYFTFAFEAPITVFPELAEIPGLKVSAVNNGMMLKGIISGSRDAFQVTPLKRELKTLFGLILSTFQNKENSYVHSGAIVGGG